MLSRAFPKVINIPRTLQQLNATVTCVYDINECGVRNKFVGWSIEGKIYFLELRTTAVYKVIGSALITLKRIIRSM